MKTKLLLLLFLANFSIYAQTNLVLNGGFENWTSTTSLPYWTTQNNVTQNAAEYWEGFNSIKLSFASSASIPKITTQVPLNAGVTYVVKFKYKYLSSNFNSSHPIVLNINKNGSATTLSNSFFATDNNWATAETTFTPDQNLSYDLSISLNTLDNIGFNANIDYVQIYAKGSEQYTLIPDLNFEKKLIGIGIDSGAPDGKVLTSSISTLTSLNVTTNVHGSGLYITDLTGIQDFTALTSLNCSGHELTTLSLTKNTALTTLNCQGNLLTSLDISKNSALTSINCSNNKLTNLDVSTKLGLTTLQCVVNKLTSLDVSQNIALKSLSCSTNSLTSLDVSKNTALTSLYCNNNPLTSLNIKNGNNTAFYWDFSYHIDFRTTTQLYCISVDDVIYSNKNWSGFRDYRASYTLACDGKYTLIPDPKFEQKLRNLYIDSGELLDGKVLTASISSLKTLDVSSATITDLTGIEDFTQITTLNCSGNSINSLDISKNLALTTFNCYNNKLTSLNVSKNLKLADLNCGRNQLTSLDVSNNAALTNLNCSYTNQFALLDFSKNPALAILECRNTNLRAINLTKNLNLANLNCSNNALTILDLPDSWDFTTLDCSSNRLPLLDVSKNTNLSYFNCSNNKLTNLDVSKNNSLTTFYCNTNKLVNLNVKNGTNTILKTRSFKDNWDLRCITVDNANSANANWSNSKENIATYNGNCGTAIAYTLIPDTNFEQKLIDIGIDTDGKNGKVLTANVASLTTLDVSSSNIVSLSGLEDFVSLTYLDCGRNKISYLDFSENVVLTTVYCSNNNVGVLNVSKNIFLNYLDINTNRLKWIDVSKNTALTYLDLSNNSIFDTFPELDVTSNTALTTLKCSDLDLTDLNISKNLSLTTLFCDHNKIEYIDVSKHTALNKLDCSSNLLWYLNLKNGNNKNLDLSSSDFRYNYNLACIQVDDAAYSTTNWSSKKETSANFNEVCNENYTLIPDINFEKKLIALKIDAGEPDGRIPTSRISFITFINLSNASITDLTGIQDFTSLTSLSCESNELTAINLSKNVALVDLMLNNNKLTSIDLSNNKALKTLRISENELISLDISNNTNLKSLFCMYNKLTILDVAKNKSLSDLRCSSNQLTNLDLSANPLWTINCSKNNLSTLNLKNGSNRFITNDIINLNLTENPLLKCIQVDDADYSTKNWAERKDAAAVFSTNCSSLGLEETVFDKAAIYPNPTKSELNIQNVNLEKANVYNTLGQLVKSFTLNADNTNNTINLSDLPKGVYFIYLINQDAASAKKIIIE